MGFVFFYVSLPATSDRRSRVSMQNSTPKFQFRRENHIKMKGAMALLKVACSHLNRDKIESKLSVPISRKIPCEISLKLL